MFLNHVHNQAGFGKPVNNGRRFIYLGILKTVFPFGKLERLIFNYTRIILSSWKSDIKTFNLNFSGTKKDVGPKQRLDKFPSIGDHIQVTPTFEHTWVTLRYTVFRNLRSGIDFWGFLDIRTIIFNKGFFSFTNFTFVTRK